MTDIDFWVPTIITLNTSLINFTQIFQETLMNQLIRFLSTHQTFHWISWLKLIVMKHFSENLYQKHTLPITYFVKAWTKTMKSPTDTIATILIIDILCHYIHSNKYYFFFLLQIYLFLYLNLKTFLLMGAVFIFCFIAKIYLSQLMYCWNKRKW